MNADILIVDDSAILRKVMRKAICQLGVPPERIREAANGQEALNALHESHSDLILLDLHMPVMGGYEFAQAKAQDEEMSQIPFVVVSTEANAQRLMEMVELGALGVLRKPFEPEDLRRMVADYLPEQPDEEASADLKILGEELPGLEKSQLERVVAGALERTAFVLTDPSDLREALVYDQHAHITYTSAGEEADIFLSASEGFLREVAASMLGLEEDDPELASELGEALSELANILAGEIVVCLGGEETRFVLGIPEGCGVATIPDAKASVACGLNSMGEGLQVSVYRRAA